MTVQPFNVSEGLNSVETNSPLVQRFYNTFVSEGLNSVETRISVMFITAIKYVSEGLNSVETIHKLYG